MSAAPAQAADCNVPGTHATIQDAIDNASCTKIIVASGTFVENLVINRGLTLTGQGQDVTIIDGNASGRVVQVGPSIDVLIENLTITNGRVVGAAGSNSPGNHGSGAAGGDVEGAGIYNNGNLSIKNVAVTDNHLIGGTGGTGGIGETGGTGGQGGTGTAGNCNAGGCPTLAGRGKTGNPGGLGHWGGFGGNGGDALGAGILNRGTLIAENSQIANNSSTGGAGGQGGRGGKGGTGGRGGTGGDRDYSVCNVVHGGSGGTGGTGGRGGVGGTGGQGGESHGAGIWNFGEMTLISTTVEQNINTAGQLGLGGAGGATGNRGAGGAKGPNAHTSLGGCFFGVTTWGSAPSNGLAGSVGTAGDTGISGWMGIAHGGGIYNLTQLTVEASTISENTAENGGGIYNRGILAVTDGTSIAQNQVTGTTGQAGSPTGAGGGGGGGAGFGGGIYNHADGAATVSNTSLLNNSATGGAGGRGNANGGQFNGTGGRGGGPIGGYGGEGDSEPGLVGGYASGGGGGAGHETSPGYGEKGGYGGGGGGGGGKTGGGTGAAGGQGGQFGGGGALARNSGAGGGGGGAGFGGGIANQGTMTVTQSTLAGNSAAGGNGGSSAFGTANGGKGSGVGGGIYNANEIVIENSTLSGNSADAVGGIYHHGTTADVRYSTLAGNSAAAGQTTSLYANGASTTIAYSIVSGPTANSCGGTLTSGGFNLDSGSSCGLEISNSDPLLAPLAANDGSTETHAPTDGSPAVDAAGASCSAAVDQRGVARAQTVTPLGGCDIGAVEIKEAVLFTWATPWQDYYATNDALYTIGHAFRSQDLTRPDEGKITTIQDIADDYESYNSGELFWRYCNDYDNLIPGVLCPAAEDRTPAAPQADIHNKLAEAKKGFEAIYLGPNRTVTVSLDGEEKTQNLQAAAIDGALATVRELAAIHLIYGNEFMVDALRTSIGNPGQSGESIINEKIELLEKAQQQFGFVKTIFLNVNQEPLDEAGTVYLSDFFTAKDFETFAIASEREVAILIEIAERQRLLAEDEADILAILTMLDNGYANQLAQALAFAKAVQSFDNPSTESDEAQAFFLENGGWQIVDNLERLVQMAETIRTDNNLLGYDPKYVPLASYEELYDRMTRTTGGGILADLKTKETAAKDATREYDKNGSVLNDPTGPLYQLEEEFAAELASICGTSDEPEPNYLTCNGGKMKVNYSDLEAANKAVALAWQRASAIPKLISIEEHRAAKVVMTIKSTAYTINALQLSIAKLEGYKKITTVSQTTEIWAEGSDPNDPGSTAYWLDWTKDQSMCILAGATAGVLGDGCAGSVDGIFSNVGTLLGVEDKPSKIETVDQVWDPNSEEIARLEGIQDLRRAERDATIEGVNSKAEVQRLLLEQSDLLIEYEIAVAELNRVIAERNLLVERQRHLLNSRKRARANYLEYVHNPAYRIIQDDTSLEAELALERAKHYAYLTARALDYKLLGALDPNDDYRSLIPYDELYRAHNAQHIENFLQKLENINIALPAPQRNPKRLSMAQDIFGLTDERLLAQLPFTPDLNEQNWPTNIGPCTAVINNVDTLRLCKFQQRLRGGLTTNSLFTGPNPNGEKELLLLNFGTSIDQIDSPRIFWNQTIAPVGTSAAGCGGGCEGLAINIETSQTNLGGSDVQVRLSHSGVSNYRRQIGPNRNDVEIVQYQPGPTAIVGQTVPQGFPADGDTTAGVNASINGAGGLPVGFFEGLSGATTDWRFEINLSADGGKLLDVSKIEDIELAIDMLAYPVQGTSVREAEARSAESVAAFNGAALTSETAAFIAELDAQSAAADVAQRAAAAEISVERSLSVLPAIGGDYDGSLFINAPVNLGIIDLALTLTETNGSLIGYLCDGCTPLFDSSAGITGQFIESAITTDTFTIEASFVQTVNGKPVTHNLTLTGEVTDGGNFLEGTYTDQVSGLAAEVVEMGGTFLMSRQNRVTVDLSAAGPGPNQSPTARNDSATVQIGQIGTIDVLQNDTDPNGDVLTISEVTQPSHGITAIQSGKIRYTPDAGYEGSDSFEYTISDGRGGTDTATVTVAVSDSPVEPPSGHTIFLPIVVR